MKASHLPFSLWLICCGVSLAATNDPVGDYLQKAPPYVREAGTFYSDDRLLRLDVDLNNDGQLETLLSFARDRDGKQGNIWMVYQTSAGGYIEVGRMTFSPSRFYLGNIDELNRYGLVTFGPSGAGEGVLRAHLFDGATIQEVQLVAVTRGQQTPELTGKAVLDKYLGEKATSGDEVASILNAAELTQKYGIKVQPKTYREAVQELLIAQNTATAQPAATPSAATPGPPTPAPRAIPEASPPPPASVTQTAAPAVERQAPVWPWVGGGILALAVIAGLVWKRRA